MLDETKTTRICFLLLVLFVAGGFLMDVTFKLESYVLRRELNTALDETVKAFLEKTKDVDYDPATVVTMMSVLCRYGAEKLDKETLLQLLTKLLNNVNLQYSIEKDELFIPYDGRVFVVNTDYAYRLRYLADYAELFFEVR
jgi:hypothetical protein